MSRPSRFRCFEISPEIVRRAVMLYIRLPLSLRNIENLRHERGIDVSHKTIRYGWNRFGPVFSASEITATRWLLKTLSDRQLFLVPPEGINAAGCVIGDGLLTRLARIRVICRVDAGPFGIIVTSA